jgi:hypothetical protein
LPFQFTGAAFATQKWFAVIAHESGKAMCIKATSQGAKYKSSPFHSDGWAWYAPGEIACLSKETALQTENFFEIDHTQINAVEANGNLSVAPSATDCKDRILAAVNKSQRLNGREKARMAEWLK